MGNNLGLIVLKKADLINIGPRDTYRYLLSWDSFFLLQIIVSYLEFEYDIKLSTVSSLSCKLWNYFDYSLAPISSWLHVYISFDRLVSIQRPVWRFPLRFVFRISLIDIQINQLILFNLLRKKQNQLIWFLTVLIVCLAYYSPVAFCYDLIRTDTSNRTCDFTNNNAVYLVSYMDLVFRVILPFCLILVFSIMLSYSLFVSRNRIVENFLAEENQTFYKEIRLSVSIIYMNILYILIQLPVSITIFKIEFFDDPNFYLTSYVFYMRYAVNFYIILCTNALFRKNFFGLFKKF